MKYMPFLLCMLYGGQVLPAPLIYVSNINNILQNEVPIDLATNTAQPAIDFSVAGTTLIIMAVSYDGKKGYAITEQGNMVSVDLTTNSVGTPLALGSTASDIAITPDDTTAYITGYSDFVVYVVDLASNMVKTTIATGTDSFPSAVAVAPNGKTVYVSVNNGIAVIDVATNTITTTIPVNSTDGKTIVINSTGTILYLTERTNNEVIPVAIPSNTVGTAIPVGTIPQDIVISPDGFTAYVANSGDNTITPIDLTTNTPQATIATGNFPLGIFINNAGTLLYVANYNDNNVTVIDIATGATIDTIISADFDGPGWITAQPAASLDGALLPNIFLNRSDLIAAIAVTESFNTANNSTYQLYNAMVGSDVIYNETLVAVAPATTPAQFVLSTPFTPATAHFVVKTAATSNGYGVILQ